MDKIAHPMRRVQVTFTHETCGDRFFTPLMVEAYGEWREYLNKVSVEEGHPILGIGNSQDCDDYRASNGVLIQVEVPDYVEDDHG